jgi:hypothetical protein
LRCCFKDFGQFRPDLALFGVAPGGGGDHGGRAVDRHDLTSMKHVPGLIFGKRLVAERIARQTRQNIPRTEKKDEKSGRLSPIWLGPRRMVVITAYAASTSSR